jgi:hypothetical protein
MNYTVDKQGVEIEIQIVDKETLDRFSRVNNMLDGLRKISDCFHPDDGKYEFSSLPFHDLRELEDHLKSDFLPGMELLKKHLDPILLGCTPFYADYASGHIHTSIKDMNNDIWLELRRKLFNAQPLIALLSQNSPICQNEKYADYRLAKSSWSTFSDFESTNTGHWMSLAYGMNGTTLEVRIPSAAPLPQILGVATLIRVLLEEDSFIYQAANVKQNWDNVIRYGSSSISDIAVPKGIDYSGFKMKVLKVKTTDLWKIYFQENLDIFKKLLSQFSSKVSGDILKFYDFISRGHTISDSIYELVEKEKNENKLSRYLVDFSIKSCKDDSMFNYLNEDPSPFMPVIERTISIDELKEIVDKLETHPFYNDLLKVKDYSSVIPEVRTNFDLIVIDATKSIIDHESTDAYLSYFKRELKQYVESNIFNIKDERLVPGKEFVPFVQVLTDLEIL